jgi:UDP-2-acetamido-2-deoxy-ribo-hexuluronate aminotransferase
MEKIQMVDLHGQYLKIKDEIDEAIQDVINSSAFINGPQVKQLNANLSDYHNCKHTICCANGTDALQIALMALSLEPGDEVIVPDFTFIATAEVIALLKLKPVFIDVDPNTFVMDIDKFSKAISKKTKAVVPVHLYGQCANMEQIMQIASKHGISVIEDNAQAIGADIKMNGTWQKAGTVGHIGCTSFFPSKNLGCYGDGGALFTNDAKLAENIACIANHGARVKYYHDMVGVNSRLDTMQAAILLVKLKKLNEYIKARQQAANYYDEILKYIEQVKTPVRVDYSTHVFHQYTLKVERRDELQKFLAAKNIPTMIYYPVGMHNQNAYKTSGDFSVSDTLCKTAVSLPMHTELLKSQQEFIAESIKEFYKK